MAIMWLNLSKPLAKTFGCTLVKGKLGGYFSSWLLCAHVFKFLIPFGFTVGGGLEAYCVEVGG